jgi:hypothetical protein
MTTDYRGNNFVLLPPIEHWKASVLASKFAEEELWTVIKYLDSLLRKERRPRQEALRIGLDPWSYDGEDEIRAIKHRVMLAISKIQEKSFSLVCRVQDTHTTENVVVMTA